jgi:hypothetical protein
MAIVNTPRNNLQQHLAWFNTQKPQVPPRGDNLHPSTPQAVVVANLPPVVVNPVVSQPAAASRNNTTGAAPESSSMPTPANLRNSKLAAPRRSDPKAKKQENETASPEIPTASTFSKGNLLVERVKNDWTQQGTHLALTA